MKVSIAYPLYWQFAQKRQETFFRKIALPFIEIPSSSDSIIKNFKFTNAYRASDRVSQYLIKNVIYKGSQDPRELFFRTILFKLFNRIDTWKLLEKELGAPVSWEGYEFIRFEQILSKALSEKKKIYSAAYIMPSGKGSFGNKLKHQNHLQLIEMMMKTRLPEKLVEAKGLKQIYELFLEYPTIGPFLAYQFTIDVAYSDLTDADENEFVVAGPGAKDGIRKCFSDIGGWSEADVIRYMVDNQEKEFERLGLQFKSLWGRPLKLIDCQNLFCEVDKYLRVKHPEIIGISGRTRIKQKYKPHPEPIEYWYPPKWGINHLISKAFEGSPA